MTMLCVESFVPKYQTQTTRNKQRQIRSRSSRSKTLILDQRFKRTDRPICSTPSPMTSRTGPFAAPHRGKGKGDGGKGVAATAATAATAAEYPSENEFLQAVSMCHGIRDRFEAAEEFHFPWFAVLAYKYVNAHRDFLYLTRGTPEGTDNTETLHSVFFAYGIQSTAMPVDMSKLRIAQDIADRVDVNRETDRQRIPRDLRPIRQVRYGLDVWQPVHY